MTTIERLKKYMEENKLKAHDISVDLDVHLGTVTRWLKTGVISSSWERILISWLTQKELDNNATKV